MTLSGLALMLKLQSVLRRMHHLDGREYAARQRLLGTFSQPCVAQACGKEFFSYTPLSTYTYTYLLSQLHFPLSTKPGLIGLHAWDGTLHRDAFLHGLAGVTL